MTSKPDSTNPAASRADSRVENSDKKRHNEITTVSPTEPREPT